MSEAKSLIASLRGWANEREETGTRSPKMTGLLRDAATRLEEDDIFRDALTDIIDVVERITMPPRTWGDLDRLKYVQERAHLALRDAAVARKS